jgi:hypothetical protein
MFALFTGEQKCFWSLFRAELAKLSTFYRCLYSILFVKHLVDCAKFPHEGKYVCNVTHLNLKPPFQLSSRSSNSNMRTGSSSSLSFRCCFHSTIFIKNDIQRKVCRCVCDAKRSHTMLVITNFWQLAPFFWIGERNNKHSVNLKISDREQKGDKSSGIEINDSSLWGCEEISKRFSPWTHH